MDCYGAKMELGRWGGRSLTRHPRKVCWLVALVLLLVNDHLLKGSGWLPGSVTGKLSDFSGLIVAVVLLTQMIRRACGWFVGRGHNSTQPNPVVPWVAAVLVGVSFSVVQLSPAAAAAVCNALGMIGMSWKLWPDPTDLIALSVLPGAIWAAHDPWDKSRRAETTLRLARRHDPGLALVTGVSALACLATSDIDYNHVHALVANDTGVPWVVELSVLPGAMSCAGPPIEDHLLMRSDFAHERTLVMNTQDVIYVDTESGLFPDDYILNYLQSDERAQLAASRCLPVRVAVRRGYGEPETAAVVIGMTDKRREFDGRVSSLKGLKQNDDNMVVIKERHGKVSLHVGKNLYAIQLTEQAPPAPLARCALPTMPAFVSGSAALVVEDIQTQTPECLRFIGSSPDDQAEGSAGAAGAAGAGGTLDDRPREERSVIACPSPKAVTVDQSLAHTIQQANHEIGTLTRHDLYADTELLLTTLSLDAAIARDDCSQVRTDCGAIILRADPPMESSLIAPPGWTPSSSWITVVGGPLCHPALSGTGSITAFEPSAP